MYVRTGVRGLGTAVAVAGGQPISAAETEAANTLMRKLLIQYAVCSNADLLADLPKCISAERKAAATVAGSTSPTQLGPSGDVFAAAGIPEAVVMQLALCNSPEQQAQADAKAQTCQKLVAAGGHLLVNLTAAERSDIYRGKAPVRRPLPCAAAAQSMQAGMFGGKGLILLIAAGVAVVGVTAYALTRPKKG
jgi:hypothetical protein